MSKFAVAIGCAAMIFGSMFVFTNTAEAHPPLGFRIARGTARVAARGARRASRATYRAAAVPVRRSYARSSFYSPYGYSPYRAGVSIGYSPRLYAPAPVYVSPRYSRPTYGGVYFSY